MCQALILYVNDKTQPHKKKPKNLVKKSLSQGKALGPPVMLASPYTSQNRGQEDQGEARGLEEERPKDHGEAKPSALLKPHPNLRK